MTLWCLVIWLSVFSHFAPDMMTVIVLPEGFLSSSLSTALDGTVMHAAYSYGVEKFKYYFIHSFCLSRVSTPFVWNSTSVANKVKANIELSSLCPLHLSQIFFFLQRSLRKWERKKQTERNEAIEIVSTHNCGKSQWFLKVAMDTNPACMDKKKKCFVRRSLTLQKCLLYFYRIFFGHICLALFLSDIIFLTAVKIQY